MREDLGDKTEAPTPRRREQFRRDGQVARSADLSGATVMIVGLLGLSVVGPQVVNLLQALLRQALATPLDGTTPSKLFSASASSVTLAMVPMLLMILAAAVVVNIAQMGFPLTFQFPK
ncbi:MAG TPA: EscU/YscU/HrcU family type III secretion system export apparatus switch protein, partial [Tepidisphaeraceae bacterium]